MKTFFCYWTEVEKREEIGRVLFRRNRVGNGEREEEEEEESRGRAAYADNALCLRKKLDFIVVFIHHQYMTPSNLHTVRVEHLYAWNSSWDQ